VKLEGAGASFPAPLYNKWFKSYHNAHDDVQIDYQSLGSGAGVKAVQDKTVDFGASDAAMTAAEIAKVDAGIQLLPMTAGSIVLAYNLEGVDNLKLSRESYVGIFLGKVTKWNDPGIVAANPGVKLPDAEINVVVRADSSGTSFVFTKHLSAVSPEFAKSPGTNKMPNWPVGTKSKGNEGISAAISNTPGSIGYIEYGYAKLTKLKMATLQNKAGKYGQVHRAHDCLGPGGPGHGEDAGRSRRLGFGSRRRRRLSDRHVYLDYDVQEVRGAEEGRRAEGGADLLPDGRPEGQRGAGLYSLAEQGGGSRQGGAGKHRRRGGGKEIQLTSLQVDRFAAMARSGVLGR
jgi:phosphate ABC transporter phosphate-binding protein